MVRTLLVLRIYIVCQTKSGLNLAVAKTRKDTGKQIPTIVNRINHQNTQSRPRKVDQGVYWSNLLDISPIRNGI